MFDLLVGYRYKNFTVSINDQDYKEVLSTPFAGLQIGAQF